MARACPCEGVREETRVVVGCGKARGEIFADEDEEKGIRVLRASSSRPSEATVSVLSWISALTTTIEPVNPLVSVHFSAERRARQPPPPRPPPSHPPSEMCPLRPCSNPTAVGVFVRDTASWIAYSPQATEKILAGYSETLGLSVSDLLAGELGAKDGEPGSPRSVLPGAPRASPIRTGRRGPRPCWASRRRRVRRRHRRGHAGLPRGFARPVLFVFPDAARGSASRARSRRSTHEVRVRGRRRRRRTLQRYRPDRLARSPSARGGGF